MANVRMPNGTIIYNVPDGVTKAELLSRLARNGYETARLLTPVQQKSAIEEIPVIGGALSAVADIPLSAAQGLAGTGKTFTDLLGAGNAASGFLDDISRMAQDLKSAGSKEDAALAAQIQKEAEDKGIWEQVKAAAKSFALSPLETTASVAGSAVPFIAAAVTGGGIPAAAALGAASGVGMIKGDVYDAVLQKMTEAGVPVEQAQAAADKAQEYSGKNLDQQALGAALGALAAGTGVPGQIARRLGAEAAEQVISREAARGVARSIATGAAEEAVPEAIQAGQERYAQNVALQREGFDVDTMKGVAGQAAFEGLASLIPGAAGKVYETSPERARERAAQVTPSAEETPEPYIAPTTTVDPKATFERLATAAGPGVSPGAVRAVEALNRRVSNDLSINTPESIGTSRAFIDAREGDIASGTFPEEIAVPYAKALDEAKRMLEENTPAATEAQGRANVEAAQAAGVEGAGSRPDLDVAGAAGEGVSDTGVPTPTEEATQGLAPAEPVGVAGTGVPAGGVAAPEAGAVGALTPAVDLLEPIKAAPNMAERKKVARPLVSNVVDELVGDVVVPAKVITSIANVVSQEAAKGASFDLRARVGELLTKNNIALPEAAAPITEAPSAQEAVAPETPPVEQAPAISEGQEAAAPAAEVEVTPPAPPTPPAAPSDAFETALVESPTELKPVSNWFLKLVDRFGMAPQFDAWLKANLGYNSLPEALETTSKLELSATQRAGKERNLQRNYFDPIVELAGNLKVDLADLGYFLWARGAADRNRVVAELNPQEFPEGGSGLTTAQAAAGLQQLKDEGKLPALNRLARMVDALVDFNLEEDIKAKLLTREQAEQLRKAQPFYVPLKGFAKDGDMLTADVDEAADTPSRQREAARALQTAVPTGSVQEFRKAFGRGSMPFHPLFNLFQDSESRVRRRLINEALLPTLRAYKQNPSLFDGILNVYTETNPKRIMVGRDIPGGRWEPVFSMEQEYYRNRDKYMMVKDDGVAHYIEFSDEGAGPELKRMFANMSPEDLKGAMKTLARINSFMKGMLTYKNPLYLLFVAPLRDTSAAIATAMANQNIKGSPAYKKNLAAKTLFYSLDPTSWATTARYVFGKAPMDSSTGKLLEEMISAGGAPLHTRFMNVQEKADVAARAIRSLQGVDRLSPKDFTANLVDGLNRWIDGLADIVDMNARFATYRAATDLGIQPTAAARLALDSSLNLTRRGEMARSIDIAMPFFGAGIEASRKTLRILKSPKALTKVFGSMIAFGVLESLWNAGQSGDDDDDGQENYLDLDLGAGLRMNRVTLYYGSGADDYIKVPIDPMLGYFKFVGNKIGDLMAGTVTPAQATTGLFSGFASLMSPLRVPGTDVQSLAIAATPLMGKPIMENMLNQNFFGSPIYTESYPGGAPRSELGRASTGDFWKGLAKVVNAAMGGSEAVSSHVDFQPEVYRHIIEGYFGGPYQLAKQMAGLKEAEGMADVPGIKSFVGTGSEYTPQSKYFDNSEVVRQIMGRLSKLTPEQQAAQGAKFTADTDPRIIIAFKAVDSNLDRINKEQKATMALARTDADKKLVLDYYRRQKNEYYSAFNAVYNSAKRGE